MAEGWIMANPALVQARMMFFIAGMGGGGVPSVEHHAATTRARRTGLANVRFGPVGRTTGRWQRFPDPGLSHSLDQWCYKARVIVKLPNLGVSFWPANSRVTS